MRAQAVSGRFTPSTARAMQRRSTQARKNRSEAARAEARELLVQAAPEAVEVLTDTMRSSKSAIARVQAAKEILERALGRPDREPSDLGAVDVDKVNAFFKERFGGSVRPVR
jgi:hypothetical protein